MTKGTQFQFQELKFLQSINMDVFMNVNDSLSPDNVEIINDESLKERIETDEFFESIKMIEKINKIYDNIRTPDKDSDQEIEEQLEE